MIPAEVVKFIEVCQWDSARFLIVSGNVFGPLIYYSHLLPLASSLLLTLFIFIKNRKNISARWLMATVTLLSVWLFSDLILWATEKPSFTMFFWSIINLVEPMIYAGMIFFAYAIIGGKELSFNKKLVILLLLLPTIILTSTRFGLLHYDLSNCDREAIEGPVAYINYAIELFFSLWILAFGVKRFFSASSADEKNKIALVTFGIVFFLLSFAMGNVVGSLFIDWVIGQYGLFGIPVFVGVLSYLIVHYKTFNVKMIAAQALVVALWILIISILFIRTIEIVRIIVPLTAMLLLVLGIYLVRSVKREVEQKEQIAKMAEDVRRAYAIEKKAKEQLEQLDKVKDQFLMTTQHNLRTPLTSMMGYSDLLLNGSFGKQNKKTVEVIKKFQTLSNGMIKMVNDFLDMAQFQLGKSVITLKLDVELEPILNEIVTELQFKADSKGLYLKMEKPEKIFKIQADREKIKAALFNIVDNAIKYTVTGGVKIMVKNHDTVKITVADTGIGIPKAKQETIFSQMFERGEEAKKVAAIGSGVGLYLSGQIIKSHKGKVWVESEEGKGSIFHIELPLSQ